MATTKRAPAVVDTPAQRKADRARIHIGKKALQWDDAFYREKLQSECGVTSSTQLDAAGRKRFIAHMVLCGWADGRKAATEADRPVRTHLTKPQKKMWSLWQQLADAGLVANRKMPALLAYIQRQTQVDRLEWLNAAQQDLVIESLKLWLSRKTATPPGGAV